MGLGNPEKDSLGNQIINSLDVSDTNTAQLVSEFIRELAEDKGLNVAPSREAAIYYTDTALQAYALWINRPANEKYRQDYLKAVEAGVDLYMQTGHAERMQIIEDMSRGQVQLRELVKKHFENVIDEYEIDGQRIDVYLPEEMLAVEFDGKQHYQYCPYFHESEADFVYQQRLDREKERKCRERGITLIRIRYDEEISVKTILAKVMQVKT